MRSKDHPAFRPCFAAITVMRGGEYASQTWYLPFIANVLLCLLFFGSVKSNLSSKPLMISLTSFCCLSLLMALMHCSRLSAHCVRCFSSLM